MLNKNVISVPTKNLVRVLQLADPTIRVFPNWDQKVVDSMSLLPSKVQIPLSKNWFKRIELDEEEASNSNANSFQKDIQLDF